MITAIHMGGVLGLVLAAQQDGGLCRDPSERLSGGVDDIPLPVNLTGFCLLYTSSPLRCFRALKEKAS